MGSTQCYMCKKMFSTPNMARHYKSCSQKSSHLTPDEMVEKIFELENKNTLILDEKNREIEKQGYMIEQLKIDLKKLHIQQITNNNDHSTTTNNNNITMNINHYYVMDKDGLRDGLDLTKLRAFGDENVGYVDKTKPLPTILKDIYCNSEHPENRVISHEFLNLQWILFRYKDHILSLNLEHDRANMQVMRQIVCDNVERLLGTKFENGDERILATRELLRELDKEVRHLEKDVGLHNAKDMLPIWNKAQVAGVEDRIWGQYMEDPKYSQNVARQA